MKRYIIYLFCTFFIHVGVNAETINLEQARALALANSRSLAKYNLNLRSSELDEKSQLYSMLPSLSADYSASMNYLDNDFNFVNPIDTFDSRATLSVTQTIFQGGKSFIKKAISELNSESLRKDALNEYFNVLDSADSAYYAVLEDAASLEASESALAATLSSLAIAEIRQSSGMINQGDYLKALADKESQENSRNQARRNLSLSTAKLKSLLGIDFIPQPEHIDFSGYEALIQYLGNISDEDAESLYNNLWKIIVSSNPSLAKYALNNQKAAKNLSLARRETSPVISATIFSGSIGYSSANGFGSSSGGGVTIRGSIPLDFWVFSNTIEKSKISASMAALDYAGAEIQLETDLQSAIINAFTQAESVLSSRRSLEYTQKHFEYVEERYRLSQSSVSELGDASSLLISSRNNLIKSQFGFLQSLSRIRSLGAMDDEQKLVNILLGK